MLRLVIGFIIPICIFKSGFSNILILSSFGSSRRCRSFNSCLYAVYRRARCTGVKFRRLLGYFGKSIAFVNKVRLGRELGDELGSKLGSKLYCELGSKLGSKLGNELDSELGTRGER
jgi:hypothetical protein